MTDPCWTDRSNVPQNSTTPKHNKIDSSPINRQLSTPMSGPPSSPINCQLPRIKSSPRNVLDDLHEVQRERSNRRLNPLSSSPIKSTETSETLQSLFGKPQLASLNRTRILNARNKHSKLREMRDKSREHKVLANREKSFSDQFTHDWVDKYENEFDEVLGDVDLDRLIEEEQNANDRNSYDADYLAEQLEQELEEFELQQELEMIELMLNLELES